VIIPRSLNISKRVLPSLDTLVDLFGSREADQRDEGLGSRETWKDRRGWVDPDRSHGLREEREFILGFLSPGIRMGSRLDWNKCLPRDPPPIHRYAFRSGDVLVD
jgi:hypothetical protein